VQEFVDDALDEYKQREERFGVDDQGKPIIRELERFVILQIVDTRWREHLESMDYLREGIHLRSFAQKDPLVEYRGEGHLMFEELGREIREEVVFTLFHAEIAPQEAAELEQERLATNGNLSYAHETAAGADAIAAAGASSTAGAAALGTGGSTSTGTPQTVVASPQEKIGRNDPCWCGSGKKFKKCHGA
jgi:preprotein translocase subunit SecA